MVAAGALLAAAQCLFCPKTPDGGAALPAWRRADCGVKHDTPGARVTSSGRRMPDNFARPFYLYSGEFPARWRRPPLERTAEALDPMSGSFTSLQVDTQAPEPLWRQLYTQLDDLLSSGAVREGASLPPERELAEALGVSRSTVKRSYDQLRHDERLGGRGRAGSVVRRPSARVQPTLGRLKGFSEEMRELGKSVSTTLLNCQVVFDRRLASIFHRPSNARFLHLERVRDADGVPMMRELAWYDLTQAPDMADWDGSGSAYDRLRQVCGVELGAAEQTVEAVLSSPAEVAAFGFDAPHPCLLVKRKTRTASGALVEYVERTFRGDAYAYRMHLAP